MEMKKVGFTMVSDNVVKMEKMATRYAGGNKSLLMDAVMTCVDPNDRATIEKLRQIIEGLAVVRNEMRLGK